MSSIRILLVMLVPAVTNEDLGIAWFIGLLTGIALGAAGFSLLT